MYWSLEQPLHPEINKTIPEQAVNVQDATRSLALFVLFALKLAQVVNIFVWDGVIDGTVDDNTDGLLLGLTVGSLDGGDVGVFVGTVDSNADGRAEG